VSDLSPAMPCSGGGLPADVSDEISSVLRKGSATTAILSLIGRLWRAQRRVPAPSAASGTPAGLPLFVPPRAPAEQSRVEPGKVTVRREAFEPGCGWSGLGVLVV